MSSDSDEISTTTTVPSSNNLLDDGPRLRKTTDGAPIVTDEQQQADQDAFVNTKQPKQATTNYVYKNGDFLYNSRILMLLICSAAPILALTGK